MRKTTIILSTSLSLLIIVGQFDLWDSLLMFLLVGTIPGTSLSLPPLAMFGCVSLLVGVSIVMLLAQTPIRSEPVKKSMPKKRYSRI